ncbi:hypothetical protein FRC06_006158, partial [Ceratobasidium sp. 370]
MNPVSPLNPFACFLLLTHLSPLSLAADIMLPMSMHPQAPLCSPVALALTIVTTTLASLTVLRIADKPTAIAIARGLDNKGGESQLTAEPKERIVGIAALS